MTTIKLPPLPEIPESERTPTVLLLLAYIEAQQAIIVAQQEEIHLLKEQVQALKDEIAVLKGHKPKPKIKPSALESKKDKDDKDDDDDGLRPGSSKRDKKGLEIHEEIIVAPKEIPEGSRFKGYKDYTVQDIVIKPHNKRYRLQSWLTPDGRYVEGELPDDVIKGHFGPTLVSFVLYQYYHAHVTQPLIWEQLKELGIDISSGQVNRIITEGKDRLHAEKDEILRVGLEVSRHVHVDDTGARHKGKNGYCTHIGNEWFAWFESTRSKSRDNFLRLLRAGRTDYVLNQDAIEYMRAQKLPQLQLDQMGAMQGRSFKDDDAWDTALRALHIRDNRHVRIATEGALLGSVIENGINSELVVISDDAGQFAVLFHALCWIHAERTLAKLVGFNDEQRAALDDIRNQVWELYDALKKYRGSPTEEQKVKLGERFDEIFTAKTCYITLNHALARLHKNKDELLLVLDRPDIPLHNNLSEQDIREYVKKRKISGSTRSELGRRCRDTFASLKKTCRKLGVSFWCFLRDRVSGANNIPMLPELIRQRAAETRI